MDTNSILSPFYYKTGTMGRIGSTSYVLPIWLSYRTLNRVIRVCKDLERPWLRWKTLAVLSSPKKNLCYSKEPSF